MTSDSDQNSQLFCRRDNQGSIVALFDVASGAASGQHEMVGQVEPISASDPQVQAFLSREGNHAELLNQTDVALVRVLEDLIDALITRGVIQFTDLPQAAQTKLLARRQSRASMTNRLQLMPMGDDEGLV